MLTFSEFVTVVNATLPHRMGSAAADVRVVTSDAGDVEWVLGSGAVRVAPQSPVGVMLTPYRDGRRRGAMQVVLMDAYGVEDVTALIADHLSEGIGA